MSYCPLVVLCLPLADLHHFCLTNWLQKVTGPSSRLERHLLFASIRLCLALLFIISILRFLQVMHEYCISFLCSFEILFHVLYDKMCLCKCKKCVAQVVEFLIYYTNKKEH